MRNKMMHEPWKHNKTKKVYHKVLEAIECTNGRENIAYVVYCYGDQVFCREKEEFAQKFTRL